MKLLSLKNIISLFIMGALSIPMACQPHIEPSPQRDADSTIQVKLFSAIESGDRQSVMEIGRKFPAEFETPFVYKKYPLMTPLQYAIATKKYNVAEDMLTNFDIRKLNPWFRVNGDNAIETILRMPKTERLYVWIRNFVKMSEDSQVKYLLSDLSTIDTFKRQNEIWSAIRDRGLDAHEEETKEEKLRKRREIKIKAPQLGEVVKKFEEEEPKAIKIKKPIGIRNSGNHCYADAAMQVLMLMPSEYWIKAKDKYFTTQAILPEGLILKEQQDFLGSVFDFRGAWVSGNADAEILKDKLDIIIAYGVQENIYKHFSGTHAQEDAHEFLIAITGLLGDTKFPAFTGVSTLRWVINGIKKKSKTPEGDLTTGLELKLFNAKTEKLLEDDVLLQQVINEYFAEEIVEHKDEDVMVDAGKRFGLRGDPDYVFMALNRFDSAKNKIMTKVDFDDGIIDLGIYSVDAKEAQNFSLVGMTFHSGNSISGGHYTAYVKYGDQWYYANDSSISKSSWPAVKKDAAEGSTVMLFKRIRK